MCPARTEWGRGEEIDTKSWIYAPPLMREMEQFWDVKLLRNMKCALSSGLQRKWRAWASLCTCQSWCVAISRRFPSSKEPKIEKKNPFRLGLNFFSAICQSLTAAGIKKGNIQRRKSKMLSLGPAMKILKNAKSKTSSRTPQNRRLKSSVRAAWLLLPKSFFRLHIFVVEAITNNGERLNACSFNCEEIDETEVPSNEIYV